MWRDYWSLSLRYGAVTLAVGAISRFHLPHPVIQTFCVCHYLRRPDFSSFAHRLLELDINSVSPLAPSSSGRHPDQADTCEDHFAHSLSSPSAHLRSSLFHHPVVLSIEQTHFHSSGSLVLSCYIREKKGLFITVQTRTFFSL